MNLVGRLTALVAVVTVVPAAVVVGVAAVATGSAVWTLLVALVASFVVAVLLSVAARRLRHDVVDPLERLSDAAERADRGEMGRTAALVGGAAPEVQRLARALDHVGADVRTALEELQRSRRSFRTALDRVGTVLASTHDRPTIIGVLLETAALATGASVAVFWEWRAGALLPAAAHGFADLGAVRLTRGSGLAGRVLAEGEPMAISASAGLFDPGEPAARHGLGVPVSIDQRPYGVLCLYSAERPHGFTEDDLDTVAALARQSEAAIVNTFLHEEASRLAITDGLTGLWNRRQFDLQAAQEIDRSSRFGEPFAVVLVDVDHFKSFNDDHGHQAGDAVLVELAQRLVTATREVDVVARYGGEEFVLLLPRTDLEGARMLAEKVRSSVADAPFSHDGVELRVTLSAGVAAYPLHGATARTLVASADRALYAAKDAGRNRVVVAGQERRVEPERPAAGSRPVSPPSAPTHGGPPEEER